MFERFTYKARRVLVLAQEHAQVLHHDYIGTEHLLLGLVHDDGGVARRVLESLGVSPGDVRRDIEETVGVGESPPKGHIPFTSGAKRALELSLRESLELGHRHIGTPHVLLGLLREGGVAAEILDKHGVNLARARGRTIELLAHGTLVEELGEERRQTAVEGPQCPRCSTLLATGARWAALEIPQDDSGSARSATAVYCGACETTLGLVP